MFVFFWSKNPSLCLDYTITFKEFDRIHHICYCKRRKKREEAEESQKETEEKKIDMICKLSWSIDRKDQRLLDKPQVA